MADPIRLSGLPHEISLPEEHPEGRSGKRKPKHPHPQEAASTGDEEPEDRYEPSAPPEDENG